MFGIIYVTVNLLNGKRYIGQHKCSDETDSYLGSGKALLNAINKYGKENFRRYTLYRAETEEELDQKEIEFISAFRATENERYYNINEGGNANRMCGKNNPMYGKRGILSPSFGRKVSDEQREAMRARMVGKNNPMYGHEYTPEERAKFGLKGELHWNYGKHQPDEVKEKISKANKGKPSWAKGKTRSAEHSKHISESKRGKTPKLSEEAKQQKALLRAEQNKTESFKQKVSEANKRLHKQGIRRGAKPILCVETNVVYASSYDAARAVGCGLSSISACLSGACQTVKGFHWRRATEEEASGKMVYVA